MHFSFFQFMFYGHEFITAYPQGTLHGRIPKTGEPLLSAIVATLVSARVI